MPIIAYIKQQQARKSYKRYVGRSQCNNDRMLINVVPENHRHLNIKRLNILCLEAAPLHFTTWRGVKVYGQEDKFLRP